MSDIPTPPTPSNPIPSVDGVVASAGKDMALKLFDLNMNGTPDYREPWFWRTILGAGAWFIKAFAGQHTKAYLLAHKYQTDVKPLLEGKIVP